MHFGHFPLGKPGHGGGPWGPAHHGGPGFFQARRGDMRPIILKTLAASPLHGYEIIRQLEEKSHGMWRPSPGSVYPTLQLLEEEDLVTGTEKEGKKVYTLTEAGRQQAETAPEPPWEAHGQHWQRFAEFRQLGFEVVDQLRAVVHTGSDDDLAAVRAILARTKDELAELAKKAAARK